MGLSGESATMAEDISPATVDATTRDVKVDALVPWSATVIDIARMHAPLLDRGLGPTSPGNLPRDLDQDSGRSAATVSIEPKTCARYGRERPRERRKTTSPESR